MQQQQGYLLCSRATACLAGGPCLSAIRYSNIVCLLEPGTVVKLNQFVPGGCCLQCDAASLRMILPASLHTLMLFLIRRASGQRSCIADCWWQVVCSQAAVSFLSKAIRCSTRTPPQSHPSPPLPHLYANAQSSY